MVRALPPAWPSDLSRGLRAVELKLRCDLTAHIVVITHAAERTLAPSSRGNRQRQVPRRGPGVGHWEAVLMPDMAVNLPGEPVAPPRMLQLEPVGQCNLRCQMCALQFRQDGPPYGPPAFMDFDLFVRLVEESPQ